MGSGAANSLGNEREDERADAVVGPATSASVVVRLGITNWDAGGLVLAVLSIIAFAPPLLFDAWTVRFALMLAFTPIGVAALLSLARQRDRTALVLVGALIWTLFTSAMSGAARSALLGSAGRDLSALTVIAFVSLWAIGRAMSDRGRALMPAVIAASCALNAAVGVIQVVADVQTGDLAMYFGRPTGFSVNPVYFGALSAAGLAIATDRWTRAAWYRWTPATLVLGIAVTLSGSRVALAAALLVVLVRLATKRTRETLASVGLAVGAMAVGVLVDRVAGTGRNAAGRLIGDDGSGGGGRTSVWRYGIESIADRPLLGYGFGRFRSAVQSRFSVEFVRVNAPDDFGQAWFDSHNIVITLLVAGGVVGALLFGAWIVMWGVTVRGPLAWGLAALLLHWLLQPMSIVTLPVALLAFGAAGTARSNQPRVGRRARVACVVAGLGLAPLLLGADALLQRAATTTDPALAERAATVYLGDPVVSDVVAQVVAASAQELSEDELGWRRDAVDAEPDRPYWWTQLATAYFRRDRIDDAERAVARALDLQPTNVRALRVQAFIAISRNDEAGLRAAFERLCALGQPECDIDPADALAAGPP